MKAPILRKETVAPGISRMVLSAPEGAAHTAGRATSLIRGISKGNAPWITFASFS